MKAVPRPKPREEVKLRCPEACCGLVFSGIHEVVAHVRAHTLCCPVCSGRFDGVDSWVRHAQAQHDNPRVSEQEFLQTFVEGVSLLQD